MIRIAVVGGGYGGVYAIRTLQRSFLRHTEIWLFEPRERFVFTPLLHEVAVDILHIPSVTHEYSKIFRWHTKHIQKTVRTVDLEKRCVHTDDDGMCKFDYIILAPGSKTRLPKKMPVLELKSIDDALAIRRKVEKNVLDAARMLEKDSSSDVKNLLHCVIVGGGPTGVEIAAEMIDFLRHLIKKEHIPDQRARVTLLQSGNSLLKNIDRRIQIISKKRLQKKGVSVTTGSRVQDVNTGGVIADVDGKKREFLSKCVIWTAGVTPNELPTNKIKKIHGHFPVLRTLQIEKYPFAFAIGDASHISDGPLPDLAQVAAQQGKHVGKSIARLIRGKQPKAFRYRDQGFLLSLGQRYGAGLVHGVFIKGFLAWFIWRTVYLMKFIGVRSKMRMAGEYTLRLFKKW